MSGSLWPRDSTCSTSCSDLALKADYGYVLTSGQLCQEHLNKLKGTYYAKLTL